MALTHTNFTKGPTMNFKKQRTALRMRTAVDSTGKRYELQEWRELVSVNANGRWSPWEPYNGHGEAMTCNGKEMDRISPGVWSLGQPPMELTVLE
jgi:hypothetical protein